MYSGNEEFIIGATNIFIEESSQEMHVLFPPSWCTTDTKTLPQVFNKLTLKIRYYNALNSEGQDNKGVTRVHDTARTSIRKMAGSLLDHESALATWQNRPVGAVYIPEWKAPPL